MAAPLLGAAAKAMVYAAKHPEETSGFTIKLVMGIIAFIVVVPVISLNMIASFKDQGNINGKFAATETPMYMSVKKGYEKYAEELAEKMKEREKEIIKKHTVLKNYIYVDADGIEHTRTKEVCEARVIKKITPIDIVYYIAYINHSPTEQMKEGKEYKVKEKK